MAETFNVDIVTPSRLILSEAAKSIVVPGGQGEFQVLPGHLPLVSTLRAGTLVVEGVGGTYTYAVGTGFVEVLGDQVIVLASSAEGDHEIDIEAARAAAQKAEDLLAGLDHEDVETLHTLQDALDVARSQIEVYEGSH